MPLPSNPAARRVVLIGMRASGKTTLGRELAARLSRPFVDVDDLVAELAGRPADDVLAREGEPAFRALEERALGLAAERPGAVVATGGGSVLHGEAFARLARGAFVAWLEASPDVLLARAGQRPRPPLTDLDPRAEIVALLARREPLYRAAANVVIQVGQPGAPEPILALLSALEMEAPS
jgi:shikimate kinase